MRAGPIAGVAVLLVSTTATATSTPTPTPTEQEAWQSAGWDAEPRETEAKPATEDAEAGTGDTDATPSDEDAWQRAGWDTESPSTREEREAPEARPEPAVVDPTDAAWSQAGWGGTEEPKPRRAPPPRPDPQADPRAPPVGEIFAGSLRLTGSYLHFDDDEVFPTGDDAMALTVARLLVEADAGPYVHISFNGFGELSRTPVGSNAGGTFASAGSTRSAYRSPMLDWQFWESGTMSGQLGIDRASLRLSVGSVNIDIGRVPLTYTVTTMFSTNDFFAPFSATAVNRIYKPGVDAAQISVGLGVASSIELAGVLGYDWTTDAPTWAQSAVIARAATVGAGFEWAALGGKLAERWVAGGSIQGELGPVNLRSEFHVGIPDADGDGHDASDRRVYGRVAVGPSLTFGWRNTSIGAEYLYASDGAKDPDGYVERAAAGYTDDLPYLARHYAALAVGMEIIPIVRAGATVLVNASDGSGLAGVSVTYNVANEADLILGVFVPWGKGIESVDLMAGEVELGSEFGLAPLSVYLESRVFF